MTSPKVPHINILRFGDAQQVTVNNLVQITVTDDGEVLRHLDGAVEVAQESDGGRMTIRRQEPTATVSMTRELAPE